MSRVFWFRRDLRLQDNVALNAAIKGAVDDGDRKVVPLYAVDLEAFNSLSAIRQHSLVASLDSLGASLDRKLTIRHASDRKNFAEEIVNVAIAAGANDSLFSFVFKQGNRGIQVESPIAMIWIWAAKLGAHDTGIYYDREIITNQVFGPMVDLFAQLMTPIMFAALGITVWLGYRAKKAGTPGNTVFAVMALTAVLDLIVFNKVGSPQFMAWLAVPMMALIIFEVPRLRIPLVGLLILAATTNLIYPVFYIDLMGLGDLSVGLLTIRNALLIAMLVYANLRLSELTRK